ncbi:unnamed protein product [Kuraishia capsulata CBS 1993]|uniref:Uncharacterized protein n=1 Tax=Kuraishia capsulata CBS 1993 TaxID=1382522 RepID=W6MQU9_9ASCO|nr:uncharacterized protein KUCA_T00000220001 [Kuraishia capsulata CBS 1993]CDK24260.1 unnamed protein product [Kuraishia capsulata CBS 1993]
MDKKSAAREPFFGTRLDSREFAADEPQVSRTLLYNDGLYNNDEEFQPKLFKSTRQNRLNFDRINDVGEQLLQLKDQYDRGAARVDGSNRLDTEIKLFQHVIDVFNEKLADIGLRCSPTWNILDSDHLTGFSSTKNEMTTETANSASRSKRKMKISLSYDDEDEDEDGGGSLFAPKMNESVKRMKVEFMKGDCLQDRVKFTSRKLKGIPGSSTTLLTDHFKKLSVSGNNELFPDEKVLVSSNVPVAPADYTQQVHPDLRGLPATNTSTPKITPPIPLKNRFISESELLINESKEQTTDDSSLISPNFSQPSRKVTNIEVSQLIKKRLGVPTDQISHYP